MESLLVRGDAGPLPDGRRCSEPLHCADACATSPDRRCGDTVGLAAVGVERRRRDSAAGMLTADSSGLALDQPPPPPGIDPTSHRVIEKRRRDRMNSCLADLSRLVPSCHQRKGRGRIEKNEIIELAIKYIRHLQAHSCPLTDGSDEAESFKRRADAMSSRYEEGYRECQREAMQWMVEHEGFIPGDPVCARLMNHLHEHLTLVLRGGFPPRPQHVPRDQSSQSGSTSGYNGGGNSSSSDGNNSRPSPPMPLQRAESIPPGPDPSLLAAGLSLVMSGHAQQAAPRPHHHSLHNNQSHRSRYQPEPDPDYEPTQLYKLPHESGDLKRAHAPSESSSRSSEESNAFQYKFKTNLKKRFSADMADRFCVAAAKRARLAADTLESTSSDDVKPAWLSAGGGTTAPVSRKPPAVGLSHRVPVFALHSNGVLYLPMTVDVQALGSQAALLAAEPLPITHPINISVCFCEVRPIDEPNHRGVGVLSNAASTSGVSSAPPERITSEDHSTT